MLKALTFTVVTSVISAVLALYLLDVWMDIKSFHLALEKGDRKRVAYSFILDVVVKIIVYCAAVFTLLDFLKNFYN